jgi:hypothetical protein
MSMSTLVMIVVSGPDADHAQHGATKNQSPKLEPAGQCLVVMRMELLS